MRYSGLRSRVNKLIDQLRPQGVVVRIEGGLPEPVSESDEATFRKTESGAPENTPEKAP